MYLYYYIFVYYRFTTPSEAGAYFGKQKLPSQACAAISSSSEKSCNKQTDLVDSSTFLDILNRLPTESQLPLLSEVFSVYMQNVFELLVPNDFLLLSATAMHQLSKNGRTNVLYNLAKGMVTLRQDKEDTRFPIKRMPMGLVEYTAQFFAFDNLQQVNTDSRNLSNTYLYIRSLVQWIIDNGCRPCTVTLVKNGSNYIVDPCGVQLQ